MCTEQYLRMYHISSQIKSVSVSYTWNEGVMKIKVSWQVTRILQSSIMNEFQYMHLLHYRAMKIAMACLVTMLLQVIIFALFLKKGKIKFNSLKKQMCQMKSSFLTCICITTLYYTTY